MHLMDTNERFTTEKTIKKNTVLIEPTRPKCPSVLDQITKNIKNPQEGVSVLYLMCRFGRLGVLDR